MSKSWLGEGTVALDSWLTLGQVTKTGVITNFGVLKNQDTNGSFIGGTNNDGGSSVVPGGLLLNNDPSISIPLTSADGFLPLDSIPENWGNYGILDQISNDDSTIFGSLKTDSVFISNNFGIQNSGVEGVDPLKNEILIAQLTTKGELVLEINIEVIDPSGNSIFMLPMGAILLPAIRWLVLYYATRFRVDAQIPITWNLIVHTVVILLIPAKRKLFLVVWIPMPVIMKSMQIIIFNPCVVTPVIAMTGISALYVRI